MDGFISEWKKWAKKNLLLRIETSDPTHTHTHLICESAEVVDCGKNALRNANFRCFIVPFDIWYSNISNTVEP